MFLSHGMDLHGQLVPITDVKSGKSELICPFCHQLLTAKKGSVNEHHFAHAGETCAESKWVLAHTGIPLYDLASGFSGTDMAVLKKAYKYRTCYESWITHKQQPSLEALIAGGMITKTDGRQIVLTSLGSQFMRHVEGERSTLSVLPTATLQELLFSVRFKMLNHIDRCQGTQAAHYYQLRLQTILEQHLYVLRIQFEEDGTCYPLIKVGLTARDDINDRVAEIKRDLAKHGNVLSVSVSGVYPHYGSLERVIHKLLARSQFTIGRHQEYFSEIAASKELAHLRLDQLGKRHLNSDCSVHVTYREHARKVSAGQARQQMLYGRHLGRKTKTSSELINDHPDIHAAFNQSLSLRKASANTGKAINTVRKVYKALQELASN